MGKRHVYVIAVRKPVTLALLALTTVVMLSGVYSLAGRAYAHETHSLRDLAESLTRSDPRGRFGDTLGPFMPLVANALIFIPWGFLAFIAIDSPGRSRSLSYALTVLAGAVLAVAIEAWQSYLPTRVMAPHDVVANVTGTLAGAMLGHLRKQVRLRFYY